MIASFMGRCPPSGAVAWSWSMLVVGSSIVRHVHRTSARRTGVAVVHLNWEDAGKTWLLTAYEKGSRRGTTTDTAPVSSKDDTARPASAPLASVANPPAPEGAVSEFGSQSTVATGSLSNSPALRDGASEPAICVCPKRRCARHRAQCLEPDQHRRSRSYHQSGPSRVPIPLRWGAAGQDSKKSGHSVIFHMPFSLVRRHRASRRRRRTYPTTAPMILEK